jgi:hypothetical protein
MADRKPLLVCPVCSEEKVTKAFTEDEAEKLFGSRTVKGVTHFQSWCRECRNKNPPNSPRPEPLKKDLPH